QITLAEPAARAGWATRDLLDDRHRGADLVGDGGDDERRAAGGCERLAPGLRLDGVVEDAEVEIEARRAVTLLDQDVPECQRVLAARHRDQYRFVAREHPVLADRLAHLVAEELEEVGRAERGVVSPQLDHGAGAALATLHGTSPIISPLASAVRRPAARTATHFTARLGRPTACGSHCHSFHRSPRPSDGLRLALPLISPLASAVRRPAAGTISDSSARLATDGAQPVRVARLALPLPPDITGRSSIVSSSATTWSAVTRLSPRITSTVSGT